jgi:hypothetical protein
VTPQAALHHISFENGYSDRQIFERESEEGAQISSNSWSYSSGGVSIRDYNSNSAIWDEGVWDADNDVPGQQPLVVFFSAGNGGGFNSPYNGCLSNGPDNVSTPGNAKNVITVGNNETDRGAGGACGSFSSLGNNPEEMNASSSRGPVDPDSSGQGLFKPDVTNLGGYWVMSVEATGTASVCDSQFVLPDCPTDCSDTGPLYAYQNGTSMSCPLTAGLGGVIYQDLVVNRGVSQPKPSLIKGLLVNGARDLQPTACDYTFQVTQSVVHQGWGFVQAQKSIYGPGGSPAARKIEFENEETDNAVGTGETYSRVIRASAGEPLKITLTWTDYPAAPLSGSPLVVNDLDLEVIGPDGTFLGNQFFGNWSIGGGNADRYNVVENVYLASPQGGSYTVNVRGFQVTQDQEPDKTGVNQDFSLVWSGALADPAECGDLICEAPENSCSCEIDCGPPLPVETICDDGLDNDCDGAVDCDDLDCLGGQHCTGFCGDGICSDSEDCNSCSADCVGFQQECGNGLCETANGEDCQSCPEDCNGVSNGPPSGRFCCGQDATCATEPQCSAGAFECSDVPTVTYCCGDAVCEGAEDPTNCSVDCTIASGAVPPVRGASETPLIVTRSGGEVVLSWDPSCLLTDDDYSVYEGSLGHFASHVPRNCGTGGLTQVSFATPTGDVYFLVVPHNINREGSYGQAEPPMERPASQSACFTQELATCQ